MYFEIIGDVSGIETIAAGSGIRELARLRNATVAVDGANEKALHASDCPTVTSCSPNYTGTKPPESGARNSRSNACLKIEMAKPQTKQLVVCVSNEGHPVSLEKRKIYVTVRDADAEKHGLLRIVDESGEDYFYPKMFFRSIALPQSVKKAVLAAA